MRKPLPAVVVTALALSGCGGGNGDKKGDGGQKKDTVTVGHNQPIAFGADEYSFEPKNVTVNSGTSQPSVVRFVLRNNGALAHDLHVQKDGLDMGGTPIFGPGKTESGQATLGPGTYQFICTVGDHAALGMKGTLTVTT
jgi:plastocyanin